MTHEQLMLITRTMPMKTIQVNGEDYLERYFVGELNGTQEWLHRFLRADSERHLHSHPWDADSTILCGWYTEEVLRVDGINKREITWHVGDENIISTNKIHRIIDVEPNTWTHMKVYPWREPHWYFIDDNGVKSERPASELSWHTKYKPRTNKL